MSLPTTDAERRQAHANADLLAAALGGEVVQAHAYDTTLRDTWTVRLPGGFVHVTHDSALWAPAGLLPLGESRNVTELRVWLVLERERAAHWQQQALANVTTERESFEAGFVACERQTRNYQRWNMRAAWELWLKRREAKS